MTQRPAAALRALCIRRRPLGTGAQLRLVGQSAAAVAGLLALSGVLGWALDVPSLRRVLPGMPELRFNSALGLLLLALTWFLPLVLRYVALAAVTLLTAVSLVEYAFDVSAGVDQFLVTQRHGTHPGRIAAETAASLLLLAVARAVAELDRPGGAQLLAGVVLALQAITLLGYAYGVPVLDDGEPASATAVQAALGLLLLAVAVLTTVPGGVLRWSVDAEDAGAVLVRRLLPAALIGLPVVGGIVLLGERHGLYGASSAAALIIVGCALVVVAVTWSAAETLSRTDRRRARAMSQLTELKIDLERQVVERATQLQRRRNEIAVLEDRQRVAAELHDEVIQRLFAAGMFLQGTGDTDVQTRHRLDSAVDAMDAAIKDLRASIFELGGRGTIAADVGAAIEDVCAESAGMLGFRPETTVDDPRLRARDFRDEVLAALREALANVARHAGARHVDVTLRARDGVLVLTVTDDGRGRGADEPGTGTRIMTESARRHGGDCTWTPVQPHGTQVRWTVPLG